LSDKVWRDDVLAVAWQTVRRNGGAAGVDGETVADIEALGVDRWLGALASAVVYAPAAAPVAWPQAQVAGRKVVRFPADRLWFEYGLTHLAPRTASFPWAKA